MRRVVVPWMRPWMTSHRAALMTRSVPMRPVVSVSTMMMRLPDHSAARRSRSASRITGCLVPRLCVP